MAPTVIVSYDDTANDHDALVLARLFADARAEVALAYVRHTQESEKARERLEERDAEALLERGASSIPGEVKRHVVLSASTPEGLSALAEREDADVIVFGSDYRTPVGQIRPQASAARLLQGGATALALAPAGLRDGGRLSVGSIGLLPDGGEPEARETALGLATSLGATIARSADEPFDFLVVGSRPEAHPGRLVVSAATEHAIENAACPLLVVPRGVSVPFGAPVSA